MRIDLTQEQFDNQKDSFKALKQLTAKTYKAICNCPRCSGRGYISFSSVDNSKCWQCNTSGKVLATIRIVKKPACLSPEEIESRIKARRESAIKAHLEEGYKKVDFTVASWFPYHINFDSYYKIEKETEKAYLINRLDRLDECSILTDWVPKKAITFNK